MDFAWKMLCILYITTICYTVKRLEKKEVVVMLLEATVLSFFMALLFGTLCMLIAKSIGQSPILFFIIGFFLQVVGLVITAVVYLLTMSTKKSNNTMKKIICPNSNCQLKLPLNFEFSLCPSCKTPLYGNSKPGYIDGKHHTEYIKTVKILLKEKKLDEAERLLVKLVIASEEENRFNNYGVATFYYEQLAIIYSKQGLPDKEIEILERFAQQLGASGPKNKELLSRLNKLNNSFELVNKPEGTY